MKGTALIPMRSQRTSMQLLYPMKNLRKNLDNFNRIIQMSLFFHFNFRYRVPMY